MSTDKTVRLIKWAAIIGSLLPAPLVLYMLLTTPSEGEAYKSFEVVSGIFFIILCVGFNAFPFLGIYNYGKRYIDKHKEDTLKVNRIKFCLLFAMLVAYLISIFTFIRIFTSKDAQAGMVIILIPIVNTIATALSFGLAWLIFGIFRIGKK